jgi:hypothetical protein
MYNERKADRRKADRDQQTRQGNRDMSTARWITVMILFAAIAFGLGILTGM